MITFPYYEREEQYARAWLHFNRRYTYGPDREDLIQEAFLKYWEVQADQNKTWWYSVNKGRAAANQKYVRKANPLKLTVDDALDRCSSWKEDIHESSPEFVAKLDEVKRWIEYLRAQKKIPQYLKYYLLLIEGLNWREACEALNVHKTFLPLPWRIRNAFFKWRRMEQFKALFAQKISHKEIAARMNTSVRAVQSIRRELNKKEKQNAADNSKLNCVTNL